ncbi:MAG: hypothetical protein ABI040_07130 [Rhodoferax sp.]
MEQTKDENASSPEESLEQVGLRLKHWRETRVRGARIPVQLWTAVADLARQLGVQRVAKVLHLDYVRLKGRVQGTGREARSGRVGTRKVDAGFVEMLVSAPSSAPGRCECAIELENAQGAKMRLELSGNGLGAVHTLCSAFWGAR